MILDHHGNPIAPMRAGFVPSAPRAPKTPLVVKDEPRADAVGFTVSCVENYPLIECRETA